MKRISLYIIMRSIYGCVLHNMQYNCMSVCRAVYRSILDVFVHFAVPVGGEFKNNINETTKFSR